MPVRRVQVVRDERLQFGQAGAVLGEGDHALAGGVQAQQLEVQGVVCGLGVQYDKGRL